MQSNDPNPSDESFSKDEVASDARDVVQAIESIHPEPFIGYDGRVELHARLERLVRDLPEEITREEAYRRLASLVAGLDDLHSLLHDPERTSGGAEDERLPFSLRVIGSDLYVESVADESLDDLLGSRLVAVAGTSVPSLVEECRNIRGVENEASALYMTGRMVTGYDALPRLLDTDGVPATLTLTGERASETLTRDISPVRADTEPCSELDRGLPHPSGTGPRYRLYDDGKAAVFDPGNLSEYRESLEVRRAVGADVVEESAPAAYRSQVGDDPPDDMDELIAALPSMCETLVELFAEMEAAETDALVIDLRDNPGGDSTYAFHIGYFLGGWDAIERMARSIRVVKRRTDAHRERYGEDGHGDSGLGTAAENPACYDLSGFVESGSGQQAVAEELELLQRSETFTSFTADESSVAFDEPDQVVVVTSAGTFSSGFAGAAQLNTLGAQVVGVPSGQAPRSFGEAIPKTLPHTGLTARIAGALYHWLPDPSGDTLRPDHELTPEAFEHLDRQADAGLQLALEAVGCDIEEAASGEGAR